MNGEILHEAKTVYDQEAYSALAGLMICKLRKWPRLVLIFTGLVSVAGAAAIMIAQGRVSAVGVIVLLTGNLLCMFGLYARRFAVRMMMASSGKGDPPVNRYLFGPDGMRVCAGGGERDYPYAAIRPGAGNVGLSVLLLQRWSGLHDALHGCPGQRGCVPALSGGAPYGKPCREGRRRG